MALPDYVEITQGTAIVWGESGASGVTATLSLDGLANGAARQGASVDLGANFADEYIVELRVETGTAPTAGNTVELYLLSSTDNSNWPAKVTGSDGAYTLGTSDANLRQAGPPVATLVATNDGNTVLIQTQSIWRPRGRYVVPIVDNNLGQAFRDETTATDNGSRVILTPRRTIIND
ncbi:MAG: hypothetical protein ACK528_01445 [Alphaproteobacteria bacterium]|jgi:hypothetical protein